MPYLVEFCTNKQNLLQLPPLKMPVTIGHLNVNCPSQNISFSLFIGFVLRWNCVDVIFAGRYLGEAVN